MMKSKITPITMRAAAAPIMKVSLTARARRKRAEDARIAALRSVGDIEPLHVADVVVGGHAFPVLAFVVHGPDGVVVVDTGMIESTPEIDAAWQPTVYAWPDVGDVVAVVNTHLHFDHCGGNRRFRGKPIYVQRDEYEGAHGEDYVEEWARFEGARYELLDGDAEVLPGISVLATPGHSPGHQSVVVETDEGPVVLAGDVTYAMRQLIKEPTPPILRIHELRPRRVYLSHNLRPWDPK